MYINEKKKKKERIITNENVMIDLRYRILVHQSMVYLKKQRKRERELEQWKALLRRLHLGLR